MFIPNIQPKKQIGTLVLAPPMIALMAAVAVPATIVGVPIYVGTTARSKLKKLRPRMTKRKRSCLVVLASSVSFILSPLVAALTGELCLQTSVILYFCFSGNRNTNCCSLCLWNNSIYDYENGWMWLSTEKGRVG